MSDDVGYIGLYRKLRRNFLWKERRVFSRAEAWIDILLEVRWKDEPEDVLIGNKVFQCGYAQSLNSSETWAGRWGWSPSRVQRFLKLLNECRMLLVENVVVTTRITVLNFKEYQKQCSASDAEVKGKRSAFESEVKAEEKGKKKKRTTLTQNPIPLPEFLDANVWQSFKDDRAERKIPMTSRAEELAINRLLGWHEQGYNVEEIINLAIEKGWQGLYLPRDMKPNGQAFPETPSDRLRKAL